MSDPFTAPDYLSVSPEVLSARKLLLREIWHQTAPDVDLRYGVLNSLVAAPAAIFSQAVIEALDKWRSRTQISALADNAGTDELDEFLEMFLKNYRVVRRQPGNSSGTLRLLFSNDSIYAFGPSDVFNYNGYAYRPTRNFTFSPTTRQAYAVNEQNLTDNHNGTFSGIIEVIEVLSNAKDVTSFLETGRYFSIRSKTPLSVQRRKRR
jgi:hypothetical protein